ncbi:hypothetical protein BD770DRAFT_474850 [Pilaira anomala]|nr:hypothetical protein BD770DRAFT_474850 [Pilaira anomala]
MFSIISNLIHMPLNTVKVLMDSYIKPNFLKTTGMSSSESTSTSLLTPEEPYVILNTQVVDRKGLSSSMKLIALAEEEFDKGDKELAFNMYQVALAKMMKSFPSDVKDEILREELISMGRNMGITNLESPLNINKTDNQQIINQMGSTSILKTPTPPVIENNKPLSPEWQQQQPQKVIFSIALYSLIKFKDIATFTAKLIFRGASLIMKSPLPGLVYKSVINLAKAMFWINKKTEFSKKIQCIGIKCMKRVLEGDEIYQLYEFSCKAIQSLVKLIFRVNKKTELSKKARSLAVRCIKRILEGDELYHLCQFVSEAIHCLVMACIKAIIAYKETPGYEQTSLQAWKRYFHASTMTM